MNDVKKVLLRSLVSGLVTLASALPAAGAGSGPLNTPLVPFTNGTLGRHIWTVPGALKKNGFVTEVSCTNLDAPGTTADIGVEFFDNNGTLLNDISVVPGSGCNGAVLGVPAGNTRTIANSGTAQLHEDCIISMAAFDTGAARIVSTTSKIACTAVILDSRNSVLDPNTQLVTGRSPAVTTLKVIKRNKQFGD